MSGWRPGDRRPDRASMLRVNQAGEYGATRIYAGQLAVLRANCPEGKLIARMAAQEQRHLKRFNQLMAERRVRPTALQPLWNVAGFALGAATALMSEEAALACTDAVRHCGVPGRRTRAPRQCAGGRRDQCCGLSLIDRGDPCGLQGSNRTFEAHMRNSGGRYPLNRWKGRVRT